MYINIHQNQIHQSDSLAFLERLPSDQITLAYLDPPWGTASQLHSNEDRTKLTDEYGLFISKVVMQVHRVLTPRGNLFFHCPVQSLTDFRFILNQIFGTQPWLEIIWIYSMPRGLANKNSTKQRDNILVYSKSEDPVWNQQYRPLTKDQIRRRYPYSDERGVFRLEDLTTSIQQPKRQFKWKGFLLPANRYWRFSLTELERLASEHKVHWPSETGKPSLKRYHDGSIGEVIGTEWEDIPAFIMPDETSSRYPAQRPLRLLERVINIGSNPSDLILDPFFGSGTTIVAAQKNGRRWLGCDLSSGAVMFTTQRLEKIGLVVDKDFLIFNEQQSLSFEVFNNSYRSIVISAGKIRELQEQVNQLTKDILLLKEKMGAAGDDIETILASIDELIAQNLKQQNETIGNYIELVRAWVSDWDILDSASQIFLPSAEFLFVQISQNNSPDFSPFVLQYCKALENEILKKLFEAYRDDLRERKKGILETFLQDDLQREKTQRFAEFLKDKEKKYTLGDMIFTMPLLKLDGKTLRASNLLKDFRVFTLKFFSTRIIEQEYLKKINEIKNDFRNEAAHPYILSLEVAKKCQQKVRECLNEFILSYKPYG